MNCPKCGQPFEPPHWCEGDGSGMVGLKVNLLPLLIKWGKKQSKIKAINVEPNERRERENNEVVG